MRQCPRAPNGRVAIDADLHAVDRAKGLESRRLDDGANWMAVWFGSDSTPVGASLTLRRLVLFVLAPFAVRLELR